MQDTIDNNQRELSMSNKLMDSWQEIVNIVAELVDIPAVMITKVHETEIEVYASNPSPDNPYVQGARGNLNIGLYCETVMNQKQRLFVPNALRDPDWDHNPDLKNDMISYLGFPIEWPNGQVFGTFCIKDNKEITISPIVNKLLEKFRVAIEVELALNESEERLKYQVLELSDTEARLETQAADLVGLAEDMAVARDDLQLLNAQKDKFFSIIAHDLKGPFNALLGYSSLLSSGAKDFDQNQVAEYSGAVHESAQRVFKLLENLLEWSRLQMGRVKYQPSSVNLKEIIDTNVELFAPTAKEKAIRLSGKGETSIDVFADAHMVDTVVRNLLNNAIKFTPEKGEVTVSTQRIGDWAEVDVSDTGVGISVANAARLFRLDEKTSTVGTGGETGTGLGLHLCKEMVEKQGGQLHVESVESEGSTFRFTLPLHQQ